MKHRLNLCVLCELEMKEAYTLTTIPNEPTRFDKCDKCHKKRTITPYRIEVKRHG